MRRLSDKRAALILRLEESQALGKYRLLKRLLRRVAAFGLLVISVGSISCACCAADRFTELSQRNSRHADKQANPAIERRQPEIDLSEDEMFHRLSAHDWYPADAAGVNAGADSSRRDAVSFAGGKISYLPDLLWLPGKEVKVFITGVSTAGTVKMPEPGPVELVEGLVGDMREDWRQQCIFPFNSLSGKTVMKWNFSKNARRAGFIYLEDGSVARFRFRPDGSLELAGHRCLAGPAEARQTDVTRAKLAAVESQLFDKLTGSEWVRDATWKQDHLSTAPEVVKFDRDGHLYWRRGPQDTWKNGAAWSLINRGGPFIVLHCNSAASAPYPFANESFVNKFHHEPTAKAPPDLVENWSGPVLIPSVVADGKLALVMFVPTGLKTDLQRFEHRFIAK